MRRRREKEFWDVQTLLLPLVSSQPPLLLVFSPFLSQETPSGFEWKPDLSSPVCVLCWDVPASLSCSLSSLFIPKHKYYLTHVFVCLSRFFLFFPLSLTLSVSPSLSVTDSAPPSLNSTGVPSWPLDGQWCNQLLISHRDWQLALWGARQWVSSSLLGNFLI